jgi:hypothetical protein
MEKNNVTIVGRSVDGKKTDFSFYGKTKSDLRRIDYNLFKVWFESLPLSNPRVGITASLARDIAIMVYDKLWESGGSIEVLGGDKR